MAARFIRKRCNRSTLVEVRALRKERAMRYAIFKHSAIEFNSSHDLVHSNRACSGLSTSSLQKRQSPVREDLPAGGTIRFWERLLLSTGQERHNLKQSLVLDGQFEIGANHKGRR